MTANLRKWPPLLAAMLTVLGSAAAAPPPAQAPGSARGAAARSAAAQARAAGQADAAAQILRLSGVSGGLVVHVNCGDGAMTAALRAGPGCLVQGLLADAARVDGARKTVRDAGPYGPVSVVRWDGGRLPYADNLVNLLLLDEGPAPAPEEVMRVLAPLGAALTRGSDGAWAKTVKPWPKDIDEWTHSLHGPDGNAVARDRLAGPPRHMQWTAGPLWARSHGWTPSVTAMVSSSGRLFSICDETLTGVDGTVPDKWFLVARDAFSGVLLWKRPVPDWGSANFSGTPDSSGRFTMPPQAGKRLVAVGDTVYVTLGAAAPVTALDARTGRDLRVYPETARADEILLSDGRLIAALAERAGAEGAPPGKQVCALDAATGRLLWKKGPFASVRATVRQDPFGRLELAAGDGRVFLLTETALECLDLAAGDRRWRIDRPALPESAVTRLGFAGVFEYRLAVVVYQSGVVLLAQPEPNTPHTYHTMPGTLYAFDAASGRQMWKRAYGGWGHCTPPDVFVIGGAAWTHEHAPAEYGPAPANGLMARNQADIDYRIQALDLKTGQVIRRISTRDIFNVGHHHRCYRNRSTERFLMSTRHGDEFVDLASGENYQNHWVRSGCLLGHLPCNGLIYVAPHPCQCYIEAKLSGFWALAPDRGAAPAPTSAANAAASAAGPPAAPAAGRLADRLEKGPAYDAAARNPQSAVRNPDDWPTYRHDGLRSGATESPVAGPLRPAWQVRAGRRLSSPVIADGKVFVANVDAHTVHALDAASGKCAWCHTADARVDSPPTVHDGLAIFGSADGSVRCLRASDGALAWRFRAAPHQQGVVACDQVESPWPVPGSVLVHDGKCWFAAGRSSYLDGGIHVYALAPATGRVLTERTVYHADPQTGKQPFSASASIIPGLLNDIPGTDGAEVFIRQMCVSSPEARGGLHLFTTGGYLDSSWFNRTFWKAGRAQTSGLMVLGKDAAYGVEIYPSRSRETVFKPAARGYRLTCYSLTETAPAPPAGKAGRAAAAQPKVLWEQLLPIRITAMVRAADTIFVAGPPDSVDPKDPHGSWEGRKGGVLAALAASDGRKLAEYPLDSPPVWDGMAAAAGRLYLATLDGNVICLQQATAGTGNGEPEDVKSDKGRMAK